MTICLKTFFEDRLGSAGFSVSFISTFSTTESVSITVDTTVSVGSAATGWTRTGFGSRIDSVFLTDSCDCLRNSARRSALDVCWAVSLVFVLLRSLALMAGF